MKNGQNRCKIIVGAKYTRQKYPCKNLYNAVEFSDLNQKVLSNIICVRHLAWTAKQTRYIGGCNNFLGKVEKFQVLP